MSNRLPSRSDARPRAPFPGGVLLALLGALTAAAAPAAAQPLDPAAVLAQATAAKVAPRAGKPAGPNPYLSLLPAGAAPDYAAWNRWAAQQGKVKDAALPTDPTRLVLVGESESNDTPATADPVPGFGTATGEDPEADVTGTLAAAVPTIVGPFPEDNGSIPLAVPLGVTSGSAVRTSGVIGDGPYGSGGTGSGDFDLFQLSGLAAGDEIHVDVDTPLPFCCDLDPWVTVFSSTGAILAFNDDDGSSFDSFLRFAVPAAGTYYVALGSYLSPYPLDPFDSASGPGFASEGTYDVTIGVNALDRDYFSFSLEPGDVIAGRVLLSGARLRLFDPSDGLRISSAQDVSFFQPGPFPGGGPSFAYVAETQGIWTVRVDGNGAYALSLRVFRPALQQDLVGHAQILFVDFDGATVDPSIFGNPPGVAVLSPLASFLAGWGLTPADETAVIDGILAVLEENLSADLRVLALNGDYDLSASPGEFDVVLLNSRDHADPFGDPRVSRLVIGGTIGELGISTLGIAESVDPGNFATSETAVVLLDLLSAPPSNPNSLNQFAVAGSTTKVDLVARGVGNIAAHEAGHLFANWHTDPFNLLETIMDAGGNLPGLVGVGPDLTLGTGDDDDVDLEPDAYAPFEGFTGIEDTRNAVAFGLSTGLVDCPAVALGTCQTAQKSSLVIKDALDQRKDSLVFKWTKGATTAQAALGDPMSGALYRICVYDAAGVVRSMSAPAGGLCAGLPCWKATGPATSPKGFRYRDKDLTPDGTSSVIVKSGASPKPKVVWKAKGALLDDTPLGLTPPVVVEVSNSETSTCFGATFGPADVTVNSAAQLKAKTP